MQYVLPTFLLLLTTVPLTAQLSGRITDGQNGEPLPSATVQVEGTSIGVVADFDGNYRLTEAPEGSISLVFSYIGYAPTTIEVSFDPREAQKLDVALTAEAFMGETVVVTGQRQGQNAAINQQVRSNTIVNVVSSERIRELPDENAAESVGRLPGVSVSRSGGEGQRVNIRGLSPKFSTVALDGVTIPATGQGRQLFAANGSGGGGGGGAPPTDDRSVDLSMISSESLAGIEVYKSLTPDQDGDAIGGRVNFITAKAPTGNRYFANAQVGANTYHDSYDNLKFNGSVSTRFGKEKFGIVASGGYSSIDRSSDADNVDYRFLGEVLLNSISLNDNTTTRKRYNGSFALDYAINTKNTLFFTGLYARTDIENANRGANFGIRTNGGSFYAGTSRNYINLYNGSLSGNHLFNFADLDWKVSYIESVDAQPENYNYGFGVSNSLEATTIPIDDPYRALEFARWDANDAAGGFPNRGAQSQSNDKNYVAQVNLKKQVSFLEGRLSGFFKTGAKFIRKDRARRNYDNPVVQGGVINNAFQEAFPELPRIRNAPTAVSFIDPNEDLAGFFDNTYDFKVVIDPFRARQLYEQFEGLYLRSINPGTNNYAVLENLYAGYMMADLSLGKRLTAVGGFRYEQSDNEYTAFENFNYGETINAGRVEQSSGTLEEATSTQNYGELLPMLNVRYNILRNNDNSNGLDLRLAATRALTRPDFFNLTPRIAINTSNRTINRGEPNLLPTTAWNYDAFLTLFNNRYGLFTVGAFYKRLKNIDFLYGRDVEGPIIEERFGEQFNLRNSYTVIETINAEFPTTLRGGEVEIQTSLNWLPSPFDGIVLYGNYSLIRSEAKYPVLIAEFDEVTFATTTRDTVRSASMPGQSENIANASIGYDKGIFSGRVTWSFQGESLAYIGANEGIDGYTADYSRIDVSLSVKVTPTLSIVGSINNLTNRQDRSFVGVDRFIGSASIFGPTIWVGARYSARSAPRANKK